jgi:transcriptional regulator with GAF, ATPase, and Fis domain
VQESLEYQTATSEVLNVISRSLNQVQPVLETIVQTAGRLCAADYAMAFKLNDERFSLAAIHGAPPEFVELMGNDPPALDASTLAGRTALERRTIYIADTLTEPGYKRRQAAELGNYRTLFGVPLLREGEVIGVICLVQKAVNAFTARQIELVETFADQAVIAIENARLFEEVQARTRELQESLEHQTATSEVLDLISRAPSQLQPVFDTIVNTAAQLCEADYAVVHQLRNGNYCVVAANHSGAEYIKYLRELGGWKDRSRRAHYPSAGLFSRSRVHGTRIPKNRRISNDIGRPVAPRLPCDRRDHAAAQLGQAVL